MTLTRRQFLQQGTMSVAAALLTPTLIRAMPPASILRVAFLHLAPRAGDLVYNRQLVERAVTTAARLGAKWILTPELCICGYTFADQIGTDWIVPQPDTWMKEFCQLVARLNVTVFLSHPERDPQTTKLHNSVFVIGANGGFSGVAETIWRRDAAAMMCPYTPFDFAALRSGRVDVELLTEIHLPVNVNWQMNALTSHSIAQVCQKIGVSPRTVRYYEELGLLPGVRRQNGGRRVYGPDEIERLRFIQRLKQMGLSLQEIGDLNAVYAIRGSTQAMLEKLHELLCQHLHDVEAKIQDLQTLQSEMTSYLNRVDRRIEDLQGRKEEKKYASSRS